ncbi:hypothetical protein [Neobacillus terrae]|uniref:hypothetical protein n=1 Tax=Neobacillus terrae TaxID=3034837 RepID=UPI00140CB989|nr:hypothetical protein [Neobacillus terrae]NHM31799.1 hypothetical protein [Neobacillus terrae]
MTVFIFTLFALILGAVYNYQKKNIPLIGNLIVFFIVSMLLMNGSTILWLNLNFIKVSVSIEKYIAFVISRNIVLPLLSLIWLNLNEIAKTFQRKVIIFIMTLLVSMGIEILQKLLGMLIYNKWNPILSVMLFCVNLIISFYVWKIVKRQERVKGVGSV